MIDREDVHAVSAVRECLVEAAFRLGTISRLMRQQIPPPEGWTVEGGLVPLFYELVVCFGRSI
jgi:hypothetical protein